MKCSPANLTLLQNEFQMDPNQYKHLFLAMNKIENQSRNILVTNTIPLIQTCLVFVFNWQPSYPFSLTNFTTRQLKGSVQIPENFPVVFLNKTLELKAYGTPWGKIRKPKAAALHIWKNFFTNYSCGSLKFSAPHSLECWRAPVIWLLSLFIENHCGEYCGAPRSIIQ